MKQTHAYVGVGEKVREIEVNFEDFEFEMGNHTADGRF